MIENTIHPSRPGGQPAVCDFCSGQPVKWDYPSRASSHGEIVPGLSGYSSRGWAACDPCHRLIKRTDRAGLLKRAVKKFWQPGVPKGLLRQKLRETQDAFWASREGEPTPCSDMLSAGSPWGDRALVVFSDDNGRRLLLMLDAPNPAEAEVTAERAVPELAEAFAKREYVPADWRVRAIRKENGWAILAEHKDAADLGATFDERTR